MSDEARPPVAPGFPEPARHNGEFLAVIRPSDPAAALAEAQEVARLSQGGVIDAEEAQRRFNSITSSQPYSFRGVAGSILGTILDPMTHEALENDSVQPGDSLVPLPELLKSISQGDA